MLKRRLQQFYRYAQGWIGLREDDVLLASYPRSGSTWVRFFLCNLISLREMGGQTVDFPLLDATMPEFGVDDLRQPWRWSTIPRVVKTHRPFSGLFAKADRRVLVVRDPRDAIVSLYWYEMGRRRPRFHGELTNFIRHRQLGLPAWFRHYRTWAPRSDLVLSYEDLLAEPRSEFGRLLDLLDVNVEADLQNTAIERSRFRNVRSVEMSRGHGGDDEFESDFRFARKGGSGDWREHFSEVDRSYYSMLHQANSIEIYAP